MPIGAELKAGVRDPERVRALLRRRAGEEVGTYRYTYYDRPDRELTGGGRELRVRVIEDANGSRTVLTYREPAVDAATGSKPEHETTVDQPDVLDVVLSALGCEHLVSLEKRCANFAFTAHGRSVLATLVTVPELDGTFLEVETLTEDPGDSSPHWTRSGVSSPSWASRRRT